MSEPTTNPPKRIRPDFSRLPPEAQRDATMAYILTAVESLLDEQARLETHYQILAQKLDRLATQIKLIACIVLPIAVAVANRIMSKIWR